MKKIFALFAALMMVFSMNAATKTIYCKMAQSWWKADGAAVGAYYWGTGSGPAWPGVRMTPVSGETDLWSIDIDTDKFQNIIFTRVNGSGTVSDWGAKTADLTVPTDDKNLYTITSTNPVWGSPGVAGNWSVYAPDAPKTYKDITITIVANATPKIHYWEGGDKVVGTEWDAKPEMVATSEENTYSYTIKDVDEATGVKYLVVVGDVQSADQQAFENINKNFKELLPQVSVMGVTSWDGDKMTVADDYKSAAITLSLVAKTYDWKLTIDGNWIGGKTFNITRANNSAVVNGDTGENGKLTADVAGDYLFTWTYADSTLVVTYPVIEDDSVVTPPDTTVTPPTPGEKKTIYLNTGGATLWNQADAKFFTHSWATGVEHAQTQMTLVEGDVYKTEIPVEHDMIIFLRQSPATTSVVWEDSLGLWNKTEDLQILDSLYIITDWNSGRWSTETPVEVSYVLMGVNDDWSIGIPMTKNDAAENEEYQLLKQEISEGDSVKVVRVENGEAKHWCGNVKEGCKELLVENAVNDNIVLAPGKYDFYYEVKADAIWIAVSPANPTGFDNVVLEQKAVKVMRNGQMCILRDGIYYNMLGQIVE